MDSALKAFDVFAAGMVQGVSLVTSMYVVIVFVQWKYYLIY